MGNVFAASEPPTDYGFSGTDAWQDDKDKVGIHNPGTLDELHNMTKEVFPAAFDGARVILYKRLSNHFQVHHKIALTERPGRYQFGATCTGANQTETGKLQTTLIGEMDASGNLSANVLNQIGNRLALKFQTQMHSWRPSSAELRADYRGAGYTSSLVVSNPDLLNDLRGVFVAHHLHNFTKRLALGGEIACEWSDRIPGGRRVAMSGSARYTGDDFVASCTIGATKLHLCYYQRASDQLRIGVETEANACFEDLVTRIGYRVDLPDIRVKGSFDSNMNSAAVLEKKLAPMPFTLALSGHLDHKNNAFQLGLGVIGEIN